MKKSQREKLINAKPFTAWDIPVYAFTVITVFLLLLFFVILPSPSNNDGFSVFVNGEKIIDYSYSDREIIFLNQDFEGKVEFNESLNTITISQGHAFNVIEINNSSKSVEVIDANCSISKDCVWSPALKNGSAIVCAPHKLKITALGESLSYPPVTGGVR